MQSARQRATDEKHKFVQGAGAFQIYSNVLLPNCSVVGLRNQIQATGAISGSIYITGNLTDACATT